jgi:hypothetical protein
MKAWASPRALEQLALTEVEDDLVPDAPREPSPTLGIGATDPQQPVEMDEPPEARAEADRRKDRDDRLAGADRGGTHASMSPAMTSFMISLVPS